MCSVYLGSQNLELGMRYIYIHIYDILYMIYNSTLHDSLCEKAEKMLDMHNNVDTTF